MNEVYSALNLERQEIRLVILQPGLWNEDIECELTVVSLQDRPPYEALSYCWGPPDDLRPLILNGQHVLVRMNLEAALRRLRYVDKPRVIWADAISINQDDLKERGQQVSLMSKIYGDTLQGLFWLGEQPDQPVSTVTKEQEQECYDALKAADNATKQALLLVGQDLDIPQAVNDEDAFKINPTEEVVWHDNESDAPFLESSARFSENLDTQSPSVDPFAQDYIFHAFCTIRLLSDDFHLGLIPAFRAKAHNSLKLFGTNTFRALFWIIGRPWWRRIWTVQESVLPTKAVLIYGPVTVPWSIFTRSAVNLQKYRASCCSKVPMTSENMQMLDKFGQILTDIRALNISRSHGTKTTLAPLLRQFRTRESSEPRDKVYALLPLVTEWHDEPPIIPNYTLDPTQLYIEVIPKMIRTTKSLYILIQGSNIQRDDSRLPSWVPNWSQGETHVTLPHLNEQVGLYNAGGASGMPFAPSIIGSTVLVLEGTKIDIIANTGGLMYSQNPADFGSVLQEWHDLAKIDTRHRNEDQTRDQAFWRTICGDTVYEPFPICHVDRHINFRRAIASDEPVFQEWCHWSPSSPFHGNINQPRFSSDFARSHNIGAIEYAVKATCTQRRFFTTTHGHIGIGPHLTGYSRSHLAHQASTTPDHPIPKFDNSDIKFIDEVFVFPGGQTPFILSPIGRREVPGYGVQKCYQLAGDCYLHGFMDGEALKDYERKKEQVFII